MTNKQKFLQELKVKFAIFAEMKKIFKPNVLESLEVCFSFLIIFPTECVFPCSVDYAYVAFSHRVFQGEKKYISTHSRCYKYSYQYKLFEFISYQ